MGVRRFPVDLAGSFPSQKGSVSSRTDVEAGEPRSLRRTEGALAEWAAPGGTAGRR